MDTAPGGRAPTRRHAPNAGPAAAPATDAAAIVAPVQVHGYVDFYGYHLVSAAWIFCGWINTTWQDGGTPPRVTASFEVDEVSDAALGAFFFRDDLRGAGTGLILVVPSGDRLLGNLRSIVIEHDGRIFLLLPADAKAQLHDQDLAGRVRSLLAAAYPGEGRTRLLAAVNRRSYAGVDTLSQLTDKVLFALDEAILCPPDGLVLAGWLLAPSGTIAAIRVRCGSRVTPLRLERCTRIERGDVIESVGREYGFADLRCGFLAYLPAAVSAADVPYIEIETTRGEVGFVNVPAPKLRGLAAIRRILGLFEARYGEVPHAFDNVAGPSVRALNEERLADPPLVAAIDFGAVPSAPRHAVIVPLYGRIDYLEYQMALFSRDPEAATHAFIYVLDDPAQQRRTELLAESVHARFGIPFRLLVLSQNVGYAPANNIGLGYADSRYVCFLNSDVFPTEPGWLGRLSARLEADAGLGAVGPLLLFEDGSVQHEGLRFERLPPYGNWMFPQHPRKGWRPGHRGGLAASPAITGACLVARTEEVRRLGGFSEAYVIGDFEDTDLCLRLAEAGLAAAVDLDVRLYHLERRSQASPSQRWRLNLTLYNAWVHQKRWFGEAAAGAPTLPAPAARSDAAALQGS